VSGNNTYTGGTTISAGILKVGHLNALGDPAGAVTVNAGGALDLWGKSLTNTNPLTLSGTGVNSGGALMNSSTTAASYAGSVTLGAASSIVGESGTIALTNAGTISGAFDMTLGGTQGGSIDSVVGIGSGGLTKQGSGTWTLGAANTYSGVTTISGGTLAVTNNNGLGSTTNGTVIESGATLELRSVIVGNEAVSFGGSTTTAGGVLLASGGTSSLAGSLTIATAYSTSPVINVTGTQLTLSGVISTVGGISWGVKKQGTGTLVLSGANTYIGATLIEVGILKLGSSISPLGAQTNFSTTVSSGAALDLNGYSMPTSLA
jgi:autotransporter-associated beta strand protein